MRGAHLNFIWLTKGSVEALNGCGADRSGFLFFDCFVQKCRIINARASKSTTEDGPRGGAECQAAPRNKSFMIKVIVCYCLFVKARFCDKSLCAAVPYAHNSSPSCSATEHHRVEPNEQLDEYPNTCTHKRFDQDFLFLAVTM